MNYIDINDYELLFMVREKDQDAENILYNKYYYLIKTIVNKYKRSAIALGIDMKDLTQESFIAFSSAINSYKDSYDTSFASFLYLCINRRLYDYIRNYNTDKNKIMNNIVSLDSDDINYYISDNGVNDPLNIIKIKEYYSGLNDILTDDELKIFILYINGYKYNEIALKLNKSFKSIDGSIQRIKNKLKKYLMYDII